MFTDTHCHLNLEQFNTDLDTVLARALQAGVSKILVPGIDLETSKRAVELASRYPYLFAAIGVHPNHADSWSSHSLDELFKLAKHPKVVAVGEIGLDYYQQYTSPELQKEILEYQLNFACEVGKPVVIHFRDSFNDCWKLLSQWQSLLQRANHSLSGRPGVLHSFSGSKQEAELATNQHFFIGINGVVTYNKVNYLMDVVKETSMEDLLIETDAPYLAPQPNRGQRNEPAYIPIIASRIAAIRQLEIDCVANLTSANASKLFQWGLVD